jgi:hypothetical protein
MRRLNPTNVAKKRAHVDSLIAQGKFKEALEFSSSHIINDKPKIQYTITQGRLLSEYQIKKSQLGELNSVEVTNPHYSSAYPMRLFLIAEVIEKFKLKPEWEKHYEALNVK